MVLFSKMDATTGDTASGSISCDIPSPGASVMEKNLWVYERYQMFKYLVVIRISRPSFTSCFTLRKIRSLAL
jgi:hypothetical protein